MSEFIHLLTHLIQVDTIRCAMVYFQYKTRDRDSICLQISFSSNHIMLADVASRGVSQYVSLLCTQLASN